LSLDFDNKIAIERIEHFLIRWGLLSGAATDSRKPNPGPPPRRPETR
jgi:hypothetical protein